MAQPFGNTQSSGRTYPDIETATSNTSRTRFDWSERIFNPDLVQSTWFKRLADFPRKKKGAVIQIWDEENLFPLTDTTNGAVANTAVGFMTVDNVGSWLTRTVARNTRTGEHILITIVDEANNRVYMGVRGVTDTAAANINDEDEWQIFCPSREERSRAIEGRQRDRTNYFNYIGQTSMTLDMSKVARSWTTREGKLDEWKHQMELTENDFRRRMVMDFFLKERAIRPETIGGITTNVTYISGGFKQFAVNSTVNADNAGAPLTKNDLQDYFQNFSSINQSKSIDLIMRPEIYFDVQRLWDSQRFFNDKLPKKIQNHVTQFDFGGVIWTMHREQVLTLANEDTIFVVDTTPKFKQAAIEIDHMPTGGGEKDTNGWPSWILGQQDNDANWDKAQIIANMGYRFPGFATGMGGVWENVGH